MQDFHDIMAGLKAGQTLLYPTDTIWGLGCDASNPEAIEKIYQILINKNNFTSLSIYFRLNNSSKEEIDFRLSTSSG